MEFQPIYELSQIIKDPRSGEPRFYPYENYTTLAAAKKEARKFKGAWAIIEQRVVAKSKEAVPA